MTGHMIDEIADYLEGRLDMTQTRDIESHLAECADCADAVRFAREFRSRAEEQGLAHLRTDRIVEIAAGPGSATTVERRHLDGCESCRVELEWVRSRPGERSPAAGTHSGMKLLVPAAALAIAAVLCLVFLPPSKPHRAVAIAALATVEPLPVRITRDVPEQGSFEEARLALLEAYRDGNWAAADAAADRALDLRPDEPEVLLYRGSARLLSGRPAEAAEDFARGAAGAGPAPLREEIDWQLAQARILLGERDTAVEALDRVVGLNGRRAAEARRLREVLTGR